MKIKLTLLLAAAFIVAGCGEEKQANPIFVGVVSNITILDSTLPPPLPEIATNLPFVVKTNMPPGYTLVCNNFGQYAVRHPTGEIFNTDVSTNRQETIDNIWSFYDYIHTPGKQVFHLKADDWHDCDQSKIKFVIFTNMPVGFTNQIGDELFIGTNLTSGMTKGITIRGITNVVIKGNYIEILDDKTPTPIKKSFLSPLPTKGH